MCMQPKKLNISDATAEAQNQMIFPQILLCMSTSQPNFIFFPCHINLRLWLISNSIYNIKHCMMRIKINKVECAFGKLQMELTQHLHVKGSAVHG